MLRSHVSGVLGHLHRELVAVLRWIVHRRLGLVLGIGLVLFQEVLESGNFGLVEVDLSHKIVLAEVLSSGDHGSVFRLSPALSDNDEYDSDKDH